MLKFISKAACLLTKRNWAHTSLTFVRALDPDFLLGHRSLFPCQPHT